MKKILPHFVSGFFVLMFCWVGCSCERPTDAGKSNPPPSEVLWFTPINNGNLIDGITSNLTIPYKNGVVMVGNSARGSTLYFLDQQTGKVLWQWEEQGDSGFFIRYYHIFNNILVLCNGDAFGIDLETGKTLWKNRIVSGRAGATGIGSVFFIPDGTKARLIIGNALTGEQSELLSFPTTGDTLSGVDAPTPFIAPSGDTMLVFTPSIGVLRNNFNRTFLALYNLTKRQLVYNFLQREGTIGPETGGLIPFGRPVISNNKVYTVIGRSVQCNDLYTGRLIWRRAAMNIEINTNNLVVAGDKVLGNSQDLFFYAFNAETGETVWKTPGPGSATTTFLMNGVAYFCGGREFYAVDVATGETLWRRQSPDVLAGKSNAFFGSTVGGADGRLFVSSYLTAYAYKPAR